MDGLGVPAGSAGPVFTSSRVLKWSSMTDDEREKFAKFCAESNVAFFKDTDGSYAANIRLYDASVIDAAASFGSRRPQTAPGKPQQNRQSDAALAKGVGSRGLGPGALFDYSVYPAFVGLISGRETVKPKERPLPWLMRLIEEIYDSRYAKDTADLKGDLDEEANAQSSAQPFPAFVVEFFSKRYGLRGLVDQNCWDLLYNAHRLRKEHLEVEIFGRFVEEYYDPDDLLFFTYVRSMVQKEVSINFRARWSEMGRAATDSNSPNKAAAQPAVSGLPPPITLSYRECQLVSRVVFGSEADPLYKTFMAMVERNMVLVGPKQKAGSMGLAPDNRRIDVMQFMHIALVEYHETRPAEAAADFGSARGGGEADALLREAEQAYDARASNAGSVSGGGAGQGLSAGNLSPGGPSGPALRPSPALLEALGESMHRSNEGYLDGLLGTQEATSLPTEVQQQVRQEVQAQLEAKVDSILAAVITVTQNGAGSSSGSADVDALARRFTDLVASSANGSVGSAATANAIQAFCDGVLGSEEVRNTVEQLVQLLVQYATSRLQEAGAK